jgi:hypothetical protein
MQTFKPAQINVGSFFGWSPAGRKPCIRNQSGGPATSFCPSKAYLHFFCLPILQLKSQIFDFSAAKLLTRNYGC